MARRKSMLDTIVNQNSHASEAFFGTNPGVRKPATNRTLQETEALQEEMLNISKLIDNSANSFEVEHIEVLEESIKARGLLQPLIVMPIKDSTGLATGKYEIKSGSRRFAAISHIYQEADQNHDEKMKSKFSSVPCRILPMGATEEEIRAVVVETNTLARQLGVADIFRNFDIIFAKGQDGKYKYLSDNRISLTDAVTARLKEMGLVYKKSSVNDYIAIYFSADARLKDCLEKKLIAKRDAVVIASMPANTQKKFIDDALALPKAEFKKKMAAYKEERKAIKRGSINGADAVRYLKQMGKVADKINTSIIVTGEQAEELSKALEETKAKIAAAEEQIRKAKEGL